MKHEAVSLEQREQDLATADERLQELSERWLNARAKGVVVDPLDAKLTEAIQDWRRASAHLERTRKRVARAS